MLCIAASSCVYILIFICCPPHTCIDWSLVMCALTTASMSGLPGIYMFVGYLLHGEIITKVLLT